MTSGMDSSGDADKVRFSFGPRPIAAFVPALTRPAFRRRSPAAAQLMADWDSIAGPAIAAIAMPLKLTAGTLALGCTGPAAMELQHVSDALIGRINSHMGQIVVKNLRFVQSALRPPGPAARAVPKLAEAAARAAVADLPAGELRDALERLGRRALAPRRP
jgi:hypothetical protein